MKRFEDVRKEIGAAKDPDAVTDRVRKLFSAILPSDLKALPVPCQRLVKANVGDVLAAAVIFVRADVNFDGSAEAAEALHELSYVLMVAAARIAELC